MNELIPLQQTNINNQQIQTVNARDLHAFLEVKARFNDWIQRRIQEFDFVEGADFCSFLSESGTKGFTQNLVKPQGGRPSKEYYVSLDMAKELSMVERNEKGKQARRYFIQCEEELKNVKQNPALPDFTNPAIAARAWAEQYEKCLQLEQQVEEDKPLVEFAETIKKSDQDFLIRDAAKMLGVGVRYLFNYMRQDRWIMAKRSEPYAEKVHRGLMTVKVDNYESKDGESKQSITGYLTFKGLQSLHEKLKNIGKISRNHQLELKFAD